MISSIQRNAILFVSLIFVAIIAHTLNPFDRSTFSGHDETQAARIIEYAYNLKNGQLPPRISPHMSFELGYPIFNFYAPTAYLFTALIYLAGLNAAQALEISYFLALVTALSGGYLFFRKYFPIFVSYVGAALYVSSPVVAVDIFVRSNLAEIWFYALFPWALALLQRVSRKSFFITGIVIAGVFSVHNIFSLLSIPILFTFAMINRSKKQAMAIFVGLLISSYFLIPAIGELKFVQASKIATITDYQDHFLCLSQLWYSPWGYGGSTPSCTADGMSYMLGKVQILSGLGGIIYLFINLVNKQNKKIRTISLSVFLLLIGSLFMTLPYSSAIWQTFEPALSIIQFPWRFLLFVIFGLSFFGAYAVSSIKKSFQIGIAILLLLVILVMSPKFFVGQMMPQDEFLSTYASDSYIRNIAAYRVAEYLPSSANYDSWRQIEMDGFRPEDPGIGFGKYKNTFSQNAVLPIHYAPYWKIQIDGQDVIPEAFDNLGRPRIKVHGKPIHVTVQYKQTPLETQANMISTITLIIALIYSQPHKWRIKKI